MREKMDESQEWKAVTSEEQRQAVSAAVANAIAWFDDEVGIDTNTSQARCCEAAMFFFLPCCRLTFLCRLQFEQQLRKLKKLGDPIEMRVQVRADGYGTFLLIATCIYELSS